MALQGQQLQQEQLKTAQQQSVQNFFQNFDPTEHIGADGTVDTDSVHNSDSYKNAGNAKPVIDQTLNQIRSQQLQNKQSLQSLDNDSLGMMSRGVGALASDQDVKADNQAGRDKVREFYRNFASLSPQAARISGTFGQVVNKAQQGHLGDAVYAQQLMGADVLGQRSQQNPQAVNTGAGLVNRAAGTGEISAPPGAPPGSALNPTPSQVAGATVRQTGTGNADLDTSNMVVSAQRDAKANIDLTKRIDQLADLVKPGQVPAKVSAGLSALGISDIGSARQELVKDLARVKANLSARAQSDTRAGPILEMIPDDVKNTDVIHNAMDFTRGTSRQDLALGALREKVAKETKGQLNGFQGEYAHAVSAASPLMHEYAALSPQEQVEFFKRNFKTKEQARAFRDQVEAVKKRSPDVLGQ